MEKIYTKDQNKTKLVKAKPETIQFLLSYSKSLNITEVDGLQFESNLN
ncbi:MULTISPECIES: hypothetical protein [Maribacter]|uniref:Uncharacterized protein n=1 Tax=Maribacter aquivivus TaxID=228958 RepID=A0A1M6U1J4_9FLAO|nr:MULTISPECIES: hypothetical protein [Maribacter]MDF4222796.1 hypothetical protein [Maribacter huludaoensis]SHK63020.1 hypothetical protein SAMN04488007_3445 [Maribacter aquivivus]